jgi:hypothetical protein
MAVACNTLRSLSASFLKGGTNVETRWYSNGGGAFRPRERVYGSEFRLDGRIGHRLFHPQCYDGQQLRERLLGGWQCRK